MASTPGTTLRTGTTKVGPGAWRRARWGLVAGLALVLVAMVVPPLTGVDVKAGTAPPLLADWALRFGPSSLVAAALVAAAAVPAATSRIARLSWPRLLLLSWPVAVTWMVSLALVDGTAGLGKVLQGGTEYLQSARRISDVGELLRVYVSRIPLDSPDHWPVHLAGHPPGAVLLFVGLDRVGLGSFLAAGLVVVAVAATVPAAVALTLDRLGARDAARTALPFLVLGPAAVLMAVSADAVFAATTAWGAAALAGACAAVGRTLRGALAVTSGLLLGWCLMESYGLVLLVLLALGILAAGPGPLRGRVVVGAVSAATALAVVLAFAVAGFSWWEAYPVLHERYWAGLASRRPSWYWVVGNLAALVLCAGPLVPAAVAAGGPRLLDTVRSAWSARSARVDPVAVLVGAGLAMVAVADLSQMSKAEVERIWLPFVPWLVLSVIWLPPPWRRWGLVGQGVAGLLLQHVVRTVW